jgi:NADH dehydrogenase/NADH:ubiquinone oxidoreductase subunit G
MEKLKVKIDNKLIEVEQGTTILEAAKNDQR